MSEPQIGRTPSGEELRAEDADDVAIYDARKAELAAGAGVLPPEVSAAMLRGESS